MIPTLSFILLLATAVPPTAPAPPRSLIDLSGASTVTLSDEARGLYARGHAQLRDGDAEGAVESFSQLIEQRPDFVEAYLSRAHAYRRLEQQATAVEDQDRYALAYISDEKQVTRNSSHSFIRKEMDEVLTKRVLALTAIYFVLVAPGAVSRVRNDFGCDCECRCLVDSRYIWSFVVRCWRVVLFAFCGRYETAR